MAANFILCQKYMHARAHERIYMYTYTLQNTTNLIRSIFGAINVYVAVIRTAALVNILWGCWYWWWYATIFINIFMQKFLNYITLHLRWDSAMFCLRYIYDQMLNPVVLHFLGFSDILSHFSHIYTYLYWLDY